jgi:simple sugar transport system permease protein
VVVTLSKKSFGEKMKDLFLNEVLIVTLLAILMGLVVGAVVLMLSGFNPFEAYKTMFLGIVSKPKYVAWTVVRSTPLILTGLSVAFAFRTGLFNIGAEGQFMVGVLVASILGYLIKLPMIIHLPIVIVGATLAAGLYGGLAGYFKAKYGVHEVISTIMLNWIALYFSNYMVYHPALKNPGPESMYDIHETARTSILFLRNFEDVMPFIKGLRSVKMNWGFAISIIAVIWVAHYLFKTVQGFELRAVGHNKDAAEYAGINVNKCIIKSMFIAGALAGLAGALHVTGVSFHASKLAVSEGYGFNGIAVALMGNNSPIGVFLCALLFGGLQYGGTKMGTLGVPSEVVSIVIGAIIFLIAVSRIFKPIVKRISELRGEAAK